MVEPTPTPAPAPAPALSPRARSHSPSSPRRHSFAAVDSPTVGTFFHTLEGSDRRQRSVSEDRDGPDAVSTDAASPLPTVVPFRLASVPVRPSRLRSASYTAPRPDSCASPVPNFSRPVVGAQWAVARPKAIHGAIEDSDPDSPMDPTVRQIPPKPTSPLPPLPPGADDELPLTPLQPMIPILREEGRPLSMRQLSPVALAALADTPPKPVAIVPAAARPASMVRPPKSAARSLSGGGPPPSSRDSGIFESEVFASGSRSRSTSAASDSPPAMTPPFVGLNHPRPRPHPPLRTPTLSQAGSASSRASSSVFTPSSSAVARSSVHSSGDGTDWARTSLSEFEPDLSGDLSDAKAVPPHRPISNLRLDLAAVDMPPPLGLGLGGLIGLGLGPAGQGDEDDFQRGLDEIERYARSLPSPVPPLVGRDDEPAPVWRVDDSLRVLSLPTTTVSPVLPVTTSPSVDVSESDAYLSVDESGVEDLTTDDEDGEYQQQQQRFLPVGSAPLSYSGSAVVEIKRAPWADSAEEEILQSTAVRKGVFDASDRGLEGAYVESNTTHLIVARSTTPVLVPGLLRRAIPTLAFGLVVLDISHCQLVEIPHAIASCHTLKELDVKGNPLATGGLPAFLGNLISLRVLIADNCGLSTLPSTLAHLRHLHTLSLRFNNLRFLPGWLSRLGGLDLLLVDGNEFHWQWANLVRPILLKPPQPQPVRSESPPETDLEREREREMSPPQFATYSARSSLSATTMPTVSEGSPALSSALSNTRSSGGFSTASAPPLRHVDSTVSLAESAYPFPNAATASSSSIFLPATNGTVSPPTAHSFSLPPPASSPHLDIAEAQAAARSRHQSDRPSPPPPVPSPNPSVESTKKWGKMMFKKVSIKQMRPGSSSADVARSFSTPATPAETAVAEASSKAASASSSNSSGIFRSRVLSRAAKLTPAPLSLAAPEQPERRLSKRQSFLKLEKVPALDTMIGRSSSPTMYSHDHIDQKSALRSVMAYLRDLDDLTTEVDRPTPTTSPSLRSSPSLGSLRPSSTASSLPIRRAQSSRRLPPRSSRAESSFIPSQYGEDPSSGRTTPIAGCLPPPPPAMKLRADPAKRQAVVNEILVTEKTYLAGLQELCAIYIAAASIPVSSSSGKKDTVVPAVERRAVFGNVEAIRDFHEAVFLPDLESAVAPSLLVPSAQPDDSAAERVARVFIRHAAFLKIYSSYVNAFDSALARLQTWTVSEPFRNRSNSSSQSPLLGSTPKMAPFDPSSPAASTLSTSQRKRMKSYLKRCRANPRHSQISLESYLLLPVQRVPRYRMLLETLLSCTPREDDIDQTLLEPSPVVLEALELISAVATDMNERKRESEGRTQLLQWQHRIGNTFRSPLVQPHRSLLRTGTFTLIRTVKRSTAFLEAAGNRSVSPNPQASDVVQVHSLVTETSQQNLIALLCTDIIVFVKEPADKSDQTGPVDLYTVLRLTNSGPDKPPPVTLFGSGNMLRVVCDTRAIIYLQCDRKSDAASWANSVNLQASLN